MLHLTVKERDYGLTEKDYQITTWTTIPAGAAGQQYTPQGIVTLWYVGPAWVGWVVIIGIIVVAILGAIGFIAYSRALEKKWEAVVKWGPGAIPENGNGNSLGDLMGNVGALLMLGIMVPILGMVSEQAREMQLKPGEPKPPKPYTEAMVKAARTAVKTAEKGVGAVTREISHIREKKKVADEAERERLAEREREKKLKLEEAKEELRKKREERDRMERANR